MCACVVAYVWPVLSGSARNLAYSILHPYTLQRVMGGLASTDGARGHAPELAGAVD